jgi:hypothetical protein
MFPAACGRQSTSLFSYDGAAHIGVNATAAIGDWRDCATIRESPPPTLTA